MGTFTASKNIVLLGNDGPRLDNDDGQFVLKTLMGTHYSHATLDFIPSKVLAVRIHSGTLELRYTRNGTVGHFCIRFDRSFIDLLFRLIN